MRHYKKDGRTLKEYYCIICHKKLKGTLAYKHKRCAKCHYKTYKGKGNPNYNNHKLKGKNNPMYGKHHNLKTRQKISKALKNKYKGKKNPNYKHGKAMNKTKYTLWRRKTNLHCKIVDNLRRRVNQILRKKSNSTIDLLGCSVKYFKTYLQRRFKRGMTWKNYGKGLNKWVIDHIIPCCQFDLTKKSEQFKCFNYKNLQPLWWYENLHKYTNKEVKNEKI